MGATLLAKLEAQWLTTTHQSMSYPQSCEPWQSEAFELLGFLDRLIAKASKGESIFCNPPMRMFVSRLRSVSSLDLRILGHHLAAEKFVLALKLFDAV